MPLPIVTIPPLIVFIFSIPKMIYTGDLLVGFRVYFNQAGTYNQFITLNFPNSNEVDFLVYREDNWFFFKFY